MARPMVALARCPGLNRLPVQLIPISCRMGPLTRTRMPGELVAAEASWMQFGSCLNIASMVASTTGKYSGRQPAITALAAACSAVSARRLTGTSPNTCSGGRDTYSSIASTRSSVGGTTGSPSVQPWR